MLLKECRYPLGAPLQGIVGSIHAFSKAYQAFPRSLVNWGGGKTRAAPTRQVRVGRSNWLENALVSIPRPQHGRDYQISAMDWEFETVEWPNMGASLLSFGLDPGVERHRPDKRKFRIDPVCIRYPIPSREDIFWGVLDGTGRSKLETHF